MLFVRQMLRRYYEAIIHENLMAPMIILLAYGSIDFALGTILDS